MNLTFIPLLQVQRNLYAIPRGMERFRAYLRTMVNDSGDDLELPPLVAMNPMAKEHVPALLDQLIAIGTETAAAEAVSEAGRRVAELDDSYKVSLVLADDLKGAWTNRAASEFEIRFGRGRSRGSPWISCVLWCSEAPSRQTVRETVLTAIYRTAFVRQYGQARTLRERLAQEGAVLLQAGCSGPVLDPEEIEYTRVVIAPFLETQDMRTSIECLFGDGLGKTLGFSPQGLSDWAGLALARHDAIESQRTAAYG